MTSRAAARTPSPTLRRVDTGRLERSCEDAIAIGTRAPGIERAEVFLRRRAFAPHRHDTYAIGVTTAGVQRFRYRGAQRTCLPGQLHVLHPDEEHDGGPGTEDGFGYRIVYVDPSLVQAALGGAPLPFVADPVLPPGLPAAGAIGLLDDMDEPLDELRATTALTALADLLRAAAGGRDAPAPLDLRAVAAVRDHLAAHPTEPTPASELERIAGLDRWTLARHFRAAYGTSPDRYRTMRRLDGGAPRDRRGRLAGLRCGGGGLRRPEPHDAPVPPRLRSHARPLRRGDGGEPRSRWAGARCASHVACNRFPTRPRYPGCPRRKTRRRSARTICRRSRRPTRPA